MRQRRQRGGSANRGHPFKRDVPLAELRLYAGDWMWVVVSPDAASRSWFRAVEESPLWRGLPAVQNGRVRVLCAC